MATASFPWLWSNNDYFLLLLPSRSKNCLHFIEQHSFPRWLSGKESTCQCRRLRFNPWVWKIPWSRKWQPIPVFLPGKSHEQRSLVSYNPSGCKKLDTTEWLSVHAHTHQGEEEGNQDKNVKELQMIANLHIRIGYEDWEIQLKDDSWTNIRESVVSGDTFTPETPVTHIYSPILTSESGLLAFDCPFCP